MQWEFQWDGDPEDLLVTISGDVTVDEVNAWVQAAIADSRWRPGLRILVDHNESRMAAMTSQDIRRVAGNLERDASRIGPQRVATVVSQPVDYGMVRMADAFSESGRSFDWRVFYTIDDGRDWLRQAD